MAFLVTILAGLAFAMTAESVRAHQERVAATRKVRLRHAAQAEVNEAWARLRQRGVNSLRSLTGYPRTVNGVARDLTVTYGDSTDGLASDLIRLVAVVGDGDDDHAVEVLLRTTGTSSAATGAFGALSVHAGTNALLDSYSSSAGGYGTQDTNAHGGVAYANENAAVASNGSIHMDAGALFFASAQPGPLGSAVLDPDAYLAGTVAPAVADVPLPTITVPTLPSAGNYRLSGNRGVTFPAGSYRFRDFEVRGGATVRITGPAEVVLDSLTVRSSARIIADTSGGPVEFYVTNSLQVKTGGVVRTADRDPERLVLNVATVDADRDKVKIRSSGSVYAQIVAPQTRVLIDGGAQLFGSVIAGTLHLDDGEIHIDEDLFGGAGGSVTLTPVVWRSIAH